MRRSQLAPHCVRSHRLHRIPRTNAGCRDLWWWGGALAPNRCLTVCGGETGRAVLRVRGNGASDGGRHNGYGGTVWRNARRRREREVPHRGTPRLPRLEQFRIVDGRTGAKAPGAGRKGRGSAGGGLDRRGPGKPGKRAVARASARCLPRRVVDATTATPAEAPGLHSKKPRPRRLSTRPPTRRAGTMTSKSDAIVLHPTRGGYSMYLFPLFHHSSGFRIC